MHRGSLTWKAGSAISARGIDMEPTKQNEPMAANLFEPIPKGAPEASIARVSQILLGPSGDGNLSNNLRIVQLVAAYFQEGDPDGSGDDLIIVERYRKLVKDVRDLLENREEWIRHFTVGGDVTFQQGQTSGHWKVADYGTWIRGLYTSKEAAQKAVSMDETELHKFWEDRNAKHPANQRPEAASLEDLDAI